MSSAGKVLDAVKKRGIAGTLKKAWTLYVYDLSHDYEFRRDLSDIKDEPYDAARAFTVHPITRTDDPMLARLRADFPKESVPLAGYLRRECAIVTVLDDTRIIGFFVAAFQDFYDINHYRRWFRLGPGAAYCFAYFVAPAARRSTGAIALMYEGLRWMKFERGVQSVTAMCQSTNRPLVRFYKINKFKLTGQAIDFHKVLGLRICRMTPARMDVKR